VRGEQGTYRRLPSPDSFAAFVLPRAAVVGAQNDSKAGKQPPGVMAALVSAPKAGLKDV